MNNLDYNAVAGIGTGLIILIVLVYVATIALGLWISYLIMRTAVKNGILLAERSRPVTATAPLAPAGWYAVDGGKRYWNGESWTSQIT